ncbi:MAG: ABC transporter ATP-binding protein [Candidatus Eisenbacteria bacterium]
MEAVSKHYNHRGQLVKAMDDVDLKVEKGEFVSIVGPSGSGKSTFLLTLGGMLTPSRGSVWLNGQSLYDMAPDERARTRRQKIGFVFQTFNLVPYLTALENAQVPLMLAQMDEDSQKRVAVSLLERVGLADRLNHKPSELSVGQQQRVALARMLANDPEIVLADEPTGSLDPDTTREITEFFVALNAEGRTIVMVTHNQDTAARAQRILWLVEGRLYPAKPKR